MVSFFFRLRMPFKQRCCQKGRFDHPKSRAHGFEIKARRKKKRRREERSAFSDTMDSRVGERQVDSKKRRNRKSAKKKKKKKNQKSLNIKESEESSGDIYRRRKTLEKFQVDHAASGGEQFQRKRDGKERKSYNAPTEE